EVGGSQFAVHRHVCEQRTANCELKSGGRSVDVPRSLLPSSVIAAAGALASAPAALLSAWPAFSLHAASTRATLRESGSDQKSGRWRRASALSPDGPPPETSFESAACVLRATSPGTNCCPRRRVVPSS